MTEQQFDDHQARVRGLTGGQILSELEKAVRWKRAEDPALVSAGRTALAGVGNLLSMNHANRHEPITIAGERYDSKLEARRHTILMMREHAGLISGLEHHPEAIRLEIAGELVGTWRPDFVYFEPAIDGVERKVWEDVKGFTTWKTKAGKQQINPAYRAFKFKAKIIGALYPDVQIRVITKDKIGV